MTNTTRPRAIGLAFRDRGVRLAAGLAVAVATPVAILFYFQFQSLRDLEATSAVVLRQLSADTSESVARTVEEHLKRPHIGVLLRVAQSRTEPPDFAWIDPVFHDGLAESPFVKAFYVWSEKEPGGGHWWAYDATTAAEPPTPPTRRFREDAAAGARLLPRLRDLLRLRMAIVAFTDVIDGRPHYIQAQLRFESPARQRLTSVVAFAVDAQKLRTEYLPALLRERMAAVQQPTGFPPLAIQVLDERGVSVFNSNAAREVNPVDQRGFPIIFFDKELLEYAAPYEEHREVWRLLTSYGPLGVADVVSASTRPQMALMVVLVVAMSLGVFLVAGAAAREVRLAELKSNFVASVSHDLKTPLALIQLFAETLELGRVRTQERAQEYYRIINGEAKKLTRLIENILDFSRMEAGLRPYNMTPTELGGSVRRVLGRLEHQLAQGHYHVDARIEPELPRVLADEGAAEQAVENLLANAIKYSGDSRQIEVDVRRGGHHVVVSVRDHGIGIPRKEQGRIFRKFYRVHRDLGGGPQGTGLGLAIVDHTMRGHGGFVHVESEPDKGSTFTLHFPIPAEVGQEEVSDEAHSRDRGRAADAARPA
jgi:signal transduction histidine kinase